MREAACLTTGSSARRRSCVRNLSARSSGVLPERGRGWLVRLDQRGGGGRRGDTTWRFCVRRIYAEPHSEFAGASKLTASRGAPERRVWHQTLRAPQGTSCLHLRASSPDVSGCTSLWEGPSSVTNSLSSLCSRGRSRLQEEHTGREGTFTVGGHARDDEERGVLVGRVGVITGCVKRITRLHHVAVQSRRASRRQQRAQHLHLYICPTPPHTPPYHITCHALSRELKRELSRDVAELSTTSLMD